MKRRRAAVTGKVDPLAARHFAALDAVTQPVFVMSLQAHTGLVHANPAFFATTGLPQAAPMAEPFAWLSPDARRRVLEGMARASKQDKAVRVELDPLKMSAGLKCVDFHGKRYCVVTLVPQQQEADLEASYVELKHRVAQLTTALELEGMAAWTWKAADDRIQVDFRSSEMTSWLAAGSMEEFLHRVRAEDRDRVMTTVSEALRTDEVAWLEVCAASSGVGPRWFNMAARRLLDDDGSPVGLVGVTRDITARKAAYHGLAESEQRLRSVLEAEPECVKVVDGAGILRLMNPAGLAMVEADEAELVLGRPIAELVVPAYRDALQALHERVMAGESGLLEFEMQGLKGGRRLVESRAAPLRDAQGNVVAVLSVTRDISELRSLTREIIEASNREQERIGHDLHDGLGQQLTGVALMLKGLQSRLDRPTADIRRELEDILGLVNGAVHDTRMLAHGLSPVAVERGGLAVALRDMVRHARGTSGLRMRFSSRGWEDDCLDAAAALHLYRIAQESLNNVVRHAQARSVAIDLAVGKSRVALRIADDGQGMATATGQGDGMGLKIMGYRAQMIGASLRVTPRPGGGTVVDVAYPRALSAGRRKA